MTWNRCFLVKESTWRNIQVALKFWKWLKPFFCSLFTNATIQYALRSKNVIWKIRANWCRIKIGKFLFHLLSSLNYSAKKSKSNINYTSWTKNGVILRAIQVLISSAHEWWYDHRHWHSAFLSNQFRRPFLKSSRKPFIQNAGNIFQNGSWPLEG